jgi:hypothetical protein
MKIIDLVVTSVVVFTATSAQAQISKEDLVGCWRVQSLVVDPDGGKMEPLGKPAGQLIFTDDGNMSFIVMRADLPAEWQHTGDRISTTLITYFGTYELKGKTLTIKAEGSTRVDWRGQTLTRIVEIVPKKELAFKTQSPNVPVHLTAKPC